MLPTFVIGLREGLEAALIVGIVAAFLRKQGRSDLLRWAWAGVAAAVALCVAVGAILEAVSRDLPQKQQEGLETVIGVLAIAMVTYMVVWMRRHSRELKGSLEGAASAALTNGSGRALVAMAFLAVIREGFETVVFLLATFNESGSGTGPVAGAILGIAVSVGLGWGVYRGGLRINLAKFFRATGLVLVVVAAGLVMTALHTAHEAGWLNSGQGATLDLTWLVRPGSVQASLLTGMLGMQPRPVVVEVVGWLVYLVPVALYVGWPAGRRLSTRAIVGTALAGAIACATTGSVLLVDRPTVPRVDRTSSSVTATHPLSAAEVARRNGGRLPLGLQRSNDGTIEVTTRTTTTTTTERNPGSGQLDDRQVVTRTTSSADASFGAVPLGDPVVVTTGRLSAAHVAGVRHDRGIAAAWLLGAAVVLLGLGAGGAFGRRRSVPQPTTPTPLDDRDEALIQREVSLT